MKFQTGIVLVSLVLLAAGILTLPLWLQDLSRQGWVQAEDIEPSTPPNPTTAPNPSDVPGIPSDAPAPSDPPSPSNPPTPSEPPAPSEPPVPTQSAVPSVTPLPTVTPTLIPSPTPQVATTPSANPQVSTPPSSSSKRSVLSVAGPNCEDTTIEVSLTAYERTEPRQSVRVEFVYQTTTEVRTIRHTNDQGKAGASFPYTGEGTIYANVSDDYGSQSAAIVAAKDCANGVGGNATLGQTTVRSGRILGTDTTTMAPTSSLPVGLELYTLVGTALSLAGLGLRFIRG